MRVKNKYNYRNIFTLFLILFSFIFSLGFISAIPIAQTISPTDITQNSVTLRGEIISIDEFDKDFYFEVQLLTGGSWGSGFSTPIVKYYNWNLPVTHINSLSNLLPSRSYRYRLRWIGDESGLTSWITFTTLDIPPTTFKIQDIETDTRFRIKKSSTDSTFLYNHQRQYNFNAISQKTNIENPLNNNLLYSGEFFNENQIRRRNWDGTSIISHQSALYDNNHFIINPISGITDFSYMTDYYSGPYRFYPNAVRNPFDYFSLSYNGQNIDYPIIKHHPTDDNIIYILGEGNFLGGSDYYLYLFKYSKSSNSIINARQIGLNYEAIREPRRNHLLVNIDNIAIISEDWDDAFLTLSVVNHALTSHTTHTLKSGMSSAYSIIDAEISQTENYMTYSIDDGTAFTGSYIINLDTKNVNKFSSNTYENFVFDTNNVFLAMSSSNDIVFRNYKNSELIYPNIQILTEEPFFSGDIRSFIIDYSNNFMIVGTTTGVTYYLENEGFIITPTLTTNPVSNISNTSAVFNVEVLDIGTEGNTINLYFQYNDSLNGYSTTIFEVNETGSYNQLITNLQPNTTYSVRAMFNFEMNSFSSNYVEFTTYTATGEETPQPPPPQPPPSTDLVNGFIGNIVNLVKSFFPNATDLTTNERYIYVIVTMILFSVILILIGGTSNGINQVILYIIGLVNILLFFMFVSIGYIGYGLIVSLVLIGVILSYFKLKSGTSIT